MKVLGLGESEKVLIGQGREGEMGDKGQVGVKRGGKWHFSAQFLFGHVYRAVSGLIHVAAGTKAKKTHSFSLCRS